MNTKKITLTTALVFTLSACGMQAVPEIPPTNGVSPLAAEGLNRGVDEKIEEAAKAFELLPISKISKVEFRSDSRDRITALKFFDLKGGEVDLLEEYELRESVKGILQGEKQASGALLLTLHSKADDSEVDLLVVPGTHKVIALSFVADALFGDVDVQSLRGEWLDGEWTPALRVRKKGGGQYQEYSVNLVQNHKGQVVGLGLDPLN